MELKYTTLRPESAVNSIEKNEIIDFLFEHLDQYGDKRPDISNCVDYALGLDNKPGGIIFLAKNEKQIVGAVVINITGMNGYIPENILVYIAVNGEIRGKGIGKQLMENAIEQSKGNIALHVEKDNPAIHLYERMGFTNPYLEMRLIKK